MQKSIEKSLALLHPTLPTCKKGFLKGQLNEWINISPHSKHVWQLKLPKGGPVFQKMVCASADILISSSTTYLPLFCLFSAESGMFVALE